MLMRERYTGTVFDVADGKVEERLSQGYVIVGGRPEAAPPDPEPERPEPDERDAGPVPTEDSTISEIRAYAKERGIELPKRATKAELLAALA